MASEAQRAIEAILDGRRGAVGAHLLAQILEVSPARVEELCAELAAAYAAEDRGFVLVRVGGRLPVPEPSRPGPLRRAVRPRRPESGRLSAAALETLAIVAYKQPVSRAQIAAIRGVNVDGVMRTLQQRGYVDEVGRDPGPGQAVLYGTTRLFLEKLGLDSLDELPPLAEFVPGPEVMDALEHGLRHPDDTDPRSGGGSDDMAPGAEADPAVNGPVDLDQ